MQDTDNDVESDPTDQKPARPIEAVEHKHAAKNRENPGDNDGGIFKRMLCLELGDAFGVGIRRWQQAGEKRDAAERYEYPTDNRNGARTFVHSVRSGQRNRSANTAESRGGAQE